MSANVSAGHGPLNIECASNTEDGVAVSLERQKADLMAALNNEIAEQHKNSTYEVFVCGVSTRNAVCLDTHRYSYDSVCQVAQAFQSAGYFCCSVHYSGFNSNCSNITVCWDKRVLSAYGDVVLTEQDVPVAIGTLTPELCSEDDIYYKAVKLAGLYGINPSRWTKKRCMAYLAAATLLSIEIRIKSGTSHAAPVNIVFPDTVPSSAVQSGLAGFTVFGAPPVDTRKSCGAVQLTYIDTIQGSKEVTPEHLASISDALYVYLPPENVSEAKNLLS